MSLPESLAEQGLEAKNQAIDAIHHSDERFENRFTLRNPQFAERYLKAEAHLLVLCKFGHIPGEFIACFERAQGVVGSEHQVGGPDLVVGDRFSRVIEDAPHHRFVNEPRKVDGSEGRSNGYDEAVLVDVVKLMELPERVIPSLVRFGRVDSVYGSLRHALYFSFARGFVLRGTVGVNDRETNIPNLFDGEGHAMRIDKPAKLNEVESQVIQGGPEIRQNVARDSGDSNGNVRYASEIINDSAGKLRIGLGLDFIRVGVAEGTDCEIEISDVLFGPVNFNANARESFIGGHSGSIREQVCPIPYTISEISLLGRSTADRRMNRSEVISENMQRQRGGEIGFLFGKAGRQSREAAHSCPKGQVRSFDVGCGSKFQVWVATNRFALDGFQVTRTVPFPTTLHLPVVFDFLRVVDFRAESILNSGLVNAPAIGRKLKAVSDAVLQVRQ